MNASRNAKATMSVNLVLLKLAYVGWPRGPAAELIHSIFWNS